MRNITVENLTGAVIGAIGKDVPARNREIIEGLVRHIHAFCKEVNLTHKEWLAACEFMRRAGDISSEKRNEFILISDILGTETLVDMLDHKVTDGESESTVLGPFYRENAPILENGASISRKDFADQETLAVRGQIRDTQGRPITGVTVDVWQDAPNGYYDFQDPEQPDFNLRGRFQSDQDGRYAFDAIRPMPYPIPYDGAAGELLNYMGHHPWRPGHIHFMIYKDGYQPLISQIFDADTEYLDNDTVFAVKESLIGKMKKTEEGAPTDLEMDFDFVLKPQAAEVAQAA